MLESDSAYRGETWPATIGGGDAPIGVVVIAITESAEEGLTILAAADVPDAGEHRARVSRQRTLSGTGSVTDEME
jgi:hypothetical protein